MGNRDRGPRTADGGVDGGEGGFPACREANRQLYFPLTKVLTAYMAIHWQKPRISPIYGTPYLGKIIDLIANFPYMVYFTS